MLVVSLAMRGVARRDKRHVSGRRMSANLHNPRLPPRRNSLCDHDFGFEGCRQVSFALGELSIPTSPLSTRKRHLQGPGAGHSSRGTVLLLGRPQIASSRNDTARAKCHGKISRTRLCTTSVQAAGIQPPWSPLFALFDISAIKGQDAHPFADQDSSWLRETTTDDSPVLLRALKQFSGRQGDLLLISTAMGPYEGCGGRHWPRERPHAQQKTRLALKELARPRRCDVMTPHF
jgi:hypothetical protein